MTHDLTQRPAHAQTGLVVDGGQRLIVATAAERIHPDDDWDIAKDVVQSPDRAFMVGRYLHIGMPPNRNGHIFRDEHVRRNYIGIAHSPFDMLHDPSRVVGHYVDAKIVEPGARSAQDRVPTDLYSEAPYVKALAVVYSYLFPEAATEIEKAFDAGLAFMSMSCLPDHVSCPACGLKAPWKGYVSDAYCDHMQGRQPKWMEWPLFVGGAAIVPPTNPGWAEAHITRVSRWMAGNPDATDDIRDQVAAAIAGDPSDLQLETITAQLVELAYGEIATAQEAAVKIAPLWDGLVARYKDINFMPSLDVQRAAQPADAASPIIAARARALRDGYPIPPVAVERLVNELYPVGAAGVTDEGRLEGADREAMGGDATLAWAADVYQQMLAADTIHAAHVDPDDPNPTGNHASAIIVIRPPREYAVVVADQGEVEVDEVHITIAYLGDAADLDRDALISAVQRFAATGHTSSARISGPGFFLDGETVAVALVDGPGLPAMHHALLAELDRSGFEVVQNHGFTPHITIRYNTGQAFDVNPGFEWQISEVEVWFAGDRIVVPLTGGEQPG